ncbi:MAG: antitoxin component YwqK of YwqJK toxin-antitoxin module [Planctomycetota bacterium]|jgi:antitoxin component YwqK of YwqJK toxin-antitoxin module
MSKVLGIALIYLFVACSDPIGGGSLTITRHANGAPASRGDPLNGHSKVDDWAYFYDSGHKEKEGRYIQDRKEGVWTFWLDGGQKNSEFT